MNPSRSWSRPLNDASAGRTGEYDGLGEPDKETVLDDAGNVRQPVRQRLGIGDPLQRGIQYPVPAVRDENVAILALPQRFGALFVVYNDLAR